MNTQPTLCLVMDGEKIVLCDRVTKDLDLPQIIRDAQENGWIVRTIPLSLCAVAEEMRDKMKGLCDEISHLDKDTFLPSSLDEAWTKCFTLLSRIQSQA